ncbi:hypothetical protein Vretimale_10936 [Volvox reticuliferus]|uniref:Uncharacterized protein n=1 Tax=Volvox reticuliferus TaxID=1737510 RepID=A0A8J4LQE8_9CHLO|nr:hypothetical protein Vretifemale_12685 [Volvox reticuliferus]GIM06692.1 hypothetical protein Vretimale_10936 [Volvox reticuliferus]
MATSTASDGPPAVRSFVRRNGDRLEVEVLESKILLIIGVVFLMCFGASFTILMTGDPLLELFIIGLSICLCLIPSLLSFWHYSFRRTWLVVGPQMWRAVSGWMMMSAPDPDRFVEGPFISHQKDGLVKDFISLTVTEKTSQGLLFESTGGRFYFNPYVLQRLSRSEKEWLAGKVNDFMNEMKGCIRHGQDGSTRLKTIQPCSQHVVDYSTLPECLRPVDDFGGFHTHIRRTGNRLDVFGPMYVGCALWAAATLGIWAVLLAIVLTSKGAIWHNIPLCLLAFPMLISTMCFLGSIQGRWLVVDRYTWRLTRFWLRYPNIERDMARSQKWSDTELCGAFVDEVTTTDNDGTRMNYYYFSLRIQNNNAGADPKVIHVLASTRDEMEWLAGEVDKHIKMVKEHPFPATAVRHPAVPMKSAVIIGP